MALWEFCFGKLGLNEGKTNRTREWNGDEGDKIEEGRDEEREGETKLTFQDIILLRIL
jgi:hypothetical protein